VTTGAEIMATGLFDAGWYVGRYPDIAAAGIEPVEHYAQFGQTEARAPNAYFDEAFYRLQVGKIDGLMPLLHYARVGEAADLAPGPYFDPAWYRHAYALPRSVSALADFLRNRGTMKRLPTQRLYIPSHRAPYAEVPPGVDCFPLIFAELSAGRGIPTEAQVIAKSGLFDANHYLINGTDVHEASLDPTEHFCAYGWREGRQPNIYFNTNWYLHTNPDVERLGLNPLSHYILEGEKKGRRPIVYFDPVWYRQRYGLSDDCLVLAHFLENRRSQRFSPNRHFDLDWYLARHQQQIGPNRDPFAHYLQAGTYDDVSPAPDFDAVGFRKARIGRRSRHFSWISHPNRDNALVRSLHETYQ